MSHISHKSSEAENAQGEVMVPLQRRAFLRYSGAGVALSGLVLAGCTDDRLNDIFKQVDRNSGIVNVGSGDVGILNYAYALEQLEAAFYAKVMQEMFYQNATRAERIILKDLADHEKIHAEFLYAAIKAAGAIPIKKLTPDFSSVNFASRASVLGTAKAFEDLGVAAYNGAGKLISNPAYLTIAGKIVSVEARHAALIRDLLQNGTFVGPDVVDLNTGLEKSKSPAEVAAIANTFLAQGSKIDVSSLPKD
ncbi:ferritin-like domain-containing protein [Hymenobacter qilianensis]|uniref:Ferritin-like domain-containing protein n=1 Tax=Hymenobacter qilianensis TaxID=1385715 RepID=A0A7H0GS36_9BACT|nr:ferritin-like domain-containing protein [Hymenobacter qilianensis]QNP51102.1 ferritin-like domain-containing protein [Hymenobacter qilianensis]